MIQENWFAIPIWYDHINFDFQAVTNKCLDLSTKSDGRKVSNAGGWQSNEINLRDYKEFQTIDIIINQKIHEVFSKIGGNDDFRVAKAWINVNYPGTYNAKHAHPGAAFSGVIYTNVDEKTGNIVFFDVDMLRKHYPLKLHNDVYFHDQVIYKPQNGMLLFFPAWLSHTVEKNESDITRVSIAFNIIQRKP